MEHDGAVEEDRYSPTTIEDSGLAQLHVLIVEDNFINQKVMSQQLRKAGCVVHIANHGLECLEFLETTTFCPPHSNSHPGYGSSKIPLSVVLLDLEMPTMDGLACIKEIHFRQLQGAISGHLPVIAITANARSEQISVAQAAGMDAVVTKPFRIPDLIPQMRDLIKRLEPRKGGSAVLPT